MLKSNRAAVNRALRDAIDTRLEQSGIILDNAQKQSITDFGAIDTGNMRAGVTHYVEGDTVYSGPRASYSPYVALGTRFQAARNFVVVGGNAARPALIAIWSKPPKVD